MATSIWSLVSSSDMTEFSFRNSVDKVWFESIEMNLYSFESAMHLWKEPVLIHLEPRKRTDIFEIEGSGVWAVSEKVKKEKEPCNIEKCPKKGEIHAAENLGAGNNIGHGPTLAKNIMNAKYLAIGSKARLHPLSAKWRIAQAHHLICSESMNTDKWANVCSIFDYDINRWQSGILLSSSMAIACQLQIPLHRGNHSSTVTHIPNINYVKAVKRKIRPILDEALNAGYCSGKESITEDMDKKSKSIWNRVKRFSWTLTYDGKDYNKGVGCLGAKTLTAKKVSEVLRVQNKCPMGGDHGYNISKGTYFLEQQ